MMNISGSCGMKCWKEMDGDASSAEALTICMCTTLNFAATADRIDRKI